VGVRDGDINKIAFLLYIKLKDLAIMDAYIINNTTPTPTDNLNEIQHIYRWGLLVFLIMICLS
jgi:hypothetical protein